MEIPKLYKKKKLSLVFVYFVGIDYYYIMTAAAECRHYSTILLLDSLAVTINSSASAVKTLKVMTAAQ